MKRFTSFLLLSLFTVGTYAQRILNLDSCRALALTNNKELRIGQEKINAAHYQRKAAFTNYLPKIDVMGTYMHTQKEISLLSDDQKQSISHIGTSTSAALKEMAANNPILSTLLPALQPLEGGLNSMGQGLVDALRTDTRNLYAGTATLTQPLFMGGKIIAYNKITKYAEQLARSQHATGMQEVILNTDQAYWQVISLTNKKKLAESFLKLVQKLDEDVDKMVAEGVATKADGLSVKVKVNEAEMTLTQVDNGLSLSKMLLCQLCGLPLDTDLQLADQDMENLALPATYTESNIDLALANREELKSLELASKIYQQKVNVARSEFLPTVGLTANYLVSNPSLLNGFENKFRGMWGIGVVVKIPVFHWGEGIYKVKAAKAEANIARYQLEDVKEKVELQVPKVLTRLTKQLKNWLWPKRIWKKQKKIYDMQL